MFGVYIWYTTSSVVSHFLAKRLECEGLKARVELFKNL